MTCLECGHFLGTETKEFFFLGGGALSLWRAWGLQLLLFVVVCLFELTRHGTVVLCFGVCRLVLLKVVGTGF